jgi:Serine/Threonine/Tyrosine Kinase found in polyvalent proteins
MILDEYSKQQLQNIISGACITESESTLHATRNILCSSFATNTKIKKNFEHQQRIKEEQKLALISFAKENNLIGEEFVESELYLTEGGEAKVFLSVDGTHVIKINDGVYYNTWLDFLNSLCIHNLLFPETCYELIGFSFISELFAIVKQNFIVSNQDVDLEEVETILKTNGFNKIKKIDYYNQKLGIRLEDIHDENVIKQNGVYFFIDTVFYLDVKE